MIGTSMMVLEVSQKQAYIFNEKRLHNNIVASDTISYVTSSAFFKKEFFHLYEEEENLIYAGGGHTFLIFEKHDKAIQFAKAVSRHILERLPGLELFIKVRDYDVTQTPTKNISMLLRDLEKKKSIRKASFHQISFGVEKVGAFTSVSSSADREEYKMLHDDYREYIHECVAKESTVEKCPDGYIFTEKIENLGGTKDKNNFIAVIHIDGNQMGARVESLNQIVEERIKLQLEEKMRAGLSRERAEFEIWRKTNQEFSKRIDSDFKASLQDVYDELKKNLDQIGDNSLTSVLSLKKDKRTGKTFFPLRKIICAGDDVCFITEGRIGLETAALFLRKLEEKKNKVDGQVYHACAGVAIVHQKYPFYRAYDLAEQLCSNAKKEMAERISRDENLEMGCLSAIDWHIEYGELMGDLDQIREQMVDYSKEKNLLYARPYQITVQTDTINPTLYSYFREIVMALNGQTKRPIFKNKIARNKLKDLRAVLKRGKEETTYYSKVNFIPDILTETITSGELFDIIEILDVFIPLKGEGK